MAWTIWCFDRLESYAKRWICNIFISMRARLWEGETFIIPDTQCPKMPKNMQFRYFKCKIVSLPKSKNDFIFFVWLLCVHKLNTKPSMLHYFQSWERFLCKCKRHEAKGIQIKHALKAVRYERKQVETCYNKQEIHQGFYNQSIIQGTQTKCREESKKR